MGNPLFIIGAGFNADANTEADPLQIKDPAYYPLLPDIAKRCFEITELSSDQSIEQLFEETIEIGNWEPLEKLCEDIMRADYYVASQLFPKPNRKNSYLTFLERFPGSSFLTFNYDSLLELMLLKLKRWSPEDGYGVTARVERATIRHPFQFPTRSQSLVIHLHGTFCICTSEFQRTRRLNERVGMLEEREEPMFSFDPHYIGKLFYPYKGTFPYPNSDSRVPSRVIAPVPSKAEGLKKSFIVRVYVKALEMVRQSGTIVAIGYSFNPNDKQSYSEILEAASESGECKFLVVAPSAHEIVPRLKEEYPGVRWKAVSGKFKEWVSGGFPEVELST